MQNQTETDVAGLRPQVLDVGAPQAPRRIAFLRRPGANSALPGLIWLGGFMSNMRATKASFLDEYAGKAGRTYLRFDYSGHGESSGEFEDGTIGAWLEESLAIIRAESEGPQILIGSSMGGWLALLCAQALVASGEARRLAGLVLIAPAADMTERLIWDHLSPELREEIEKTGRCFLPSYYSASPYPITRGLIEEGRKHLILGGTVRTHCPVHILQGMNDVDVPWTHASLLVEHLAGDPVVLTLVKDADHRFSRPSDLMLLAQAIDSVADIPAQGELKLE
jgi:pimeloyl-ACP methyl ester carboxylesterase